MDTLTHLTIGIAIGELTIAKKVGKKALFFGAIAANIPDIDAAFQYLLSPAASTLFHRGLSHSIFLMCLLSPLLAFGIYKFYNGQRGRFVDWFKLIFIAWASHLSLDIFNSYGTGIFEPFSHVRVSYDTIGIIDFVFLLPLLVAAILSIAMRNKSRVPIIASIVAIILSSICLGFTFVDKHKVGKVAAAELKRQDINYTRVLTAPLPITNLIWMVVAEDADGFWKGTYCLTNDKQIKFTYMPKHHDYAAGFKDHHDFKILQQFTKGYYTLNTNQEGDLVMTDLRFGSLSFEDYQNGGLSFVIQPLPNGHIEVKRAHPDRKMNPVTLKQYFARIFKH